MIGDLLWGAPWALLLLPAPLLVRRFLAPITNHETALKVPFLHRLEDASGSRATRGGGARHGARWERIWKWIAWVLLVLSLTRPQVLDPPIEREVPTRDMLLAVDLSGSMDANDYVLEDGTRLSRLDGVKEVLGEFVSRRDGDRLGLIVFGTAAFVQAPFTPDGEVVRHLLEETQVRMAGPRTAIGDAMGLSVRVFEENSEVEERVLILFTDGNDTGSDVPPERAAEIARDEDITVHTIAFGDPTATGEEEIDEDALRAVAETSGGLFFRAEDGAALEAAMQSLDALEQRIVETVSHRPRRELFFAPLGLWILGQLLALAWVLRPRRGGLNG